MNHVYCTNGGYGYKMIVVASDGNNCNVINNSVRLAFDKVKDFVKKEEQERKLVFDRYQEFLDNDELIERMKKEKNNF